MSVSDIKVKSDSKKIFALASSYSYAGLVLNHHTQMRIKINTNEELKPNFIPCAIPSVVLTAFSIELYFKCLILLTTSNNPRGHPLFDLYNKIPEVQKQKIEKFYDMCLDSTRDTLPKSGPPPNNVLYSSDYYKFKNILKIISKAFEEWRYIYEKTNGQFAFIGSDQIIVAVEKTILTLEPKWQTLLDNRGPLPIFFEPSV